MYDYKSKIEKGFQYLGIRVIRFRWAILLMTVVVIGLAAAQLPKLSIATSVESMFTRHDQSLTDYQRFRGQFGRDEEIVLLISSADIFSLEFLTTLKQFHEDLENSLPLLKEVRSLANAPYIEPVDSGVSVGGFLDKLPWTEEEALQHRQRGRSYPGYQNLYFTPDGRHAIVVIKTQAVSVPIRDTRICILPRMAGMPSLLSKRRRSRRCRPMACDCGAMPGVSAGQMGILPLWSNSRYHR
jgi:predicted RND superfamily exporter protein